MSWHCFGYHRSRFGLIAEAPHHTHRAIRTSLAVRHGRRSRSLLDQNRIEQNLYRSEPNRSGKGWRARGLHPAIREIR